MILHLSAFSLRTSMRGDLNAWSVRTFCRPDNRYLVPNIWTLERSAFEDAVALVTCQGCHAAITAAILKGEQWAFPSDPLVCILDHAEETTNAPFLPIPGRL